MVVLQAPSAEALQEFFDKNVEAVAASGHIIESTQISFYNVWGKRDFKFILMMVYLTLHFYENQRLLTSLGAQRPELK